jgi:hypothetical protein
MGREVVGKGGEKNTEKPKKEQRKKSSPSTHRRLPAPSPRKVKTPHRKDYEGAK